MMRGLRASIVLLGAALLARAPAAEAARRPAAADFAPDRYRFQTLDISRIGRELPFVYDVPTAVKQAKGDPRTTYETWVGYGLQAYREQDFAIAADCFRTAMALTNGAPAAASHVLARALLLDDRPREAEEVWRALCARFPRDVEAQWQLGYCNFLRDDLDGALEHWTALDALAPTHPFPPLMLGLVHWSLLQMSESQRQLIIATRRAHAPAQTFLALSAIAGHNGDLPESVGWLRRGFDRLSPAEQHRWFANPAFDFLRESKNVLVAGLISEFQLNQPLPVEAAGSHRFRDGFDLTSDPAYGASLGLAPLGGGSTNAVIDPDSTRALRLAPRLVPK